MATYRRFRVQRKYINGKPTDETRLGEQIDSTDYTSLEECKRGSGCTNLEYRWVDVQNEYICEGFNKYKKQRREQRCVGTNEWVTIYPYEYQKGELIEERSEDCGFSCELDLRFYNWVTSKYSSRYVSLSKSTISKSDEYFSDPTLLSVFDYCGVVKMVPENAFYNNHRIDRISLNGCEYIGDGAFKHEPGASAGLNTIEIPNCSYIGNYAFEANGLKSKVDIINAEYIGKWAFGVAESYSSLDGYLSKGLGLFPSETLYLPKCSYIGEYAFFYHVPKKSIDLPLVKSLPKYCFFRPIYYQQTEIYEGLQVNLPECEYIDENAIKFGGISITLPKVSVIKGSPCGESMTPLRHLYLGYQGVVSFSSALVNGNWNSFRIHVPPEYYDAYIAEYGSISTLLWRQTSNGDIRRLYYNFSRLITSE